LFSVAGEAVQLVPYAVIAALSPLGVAATLVVMRGGRLKALAFAVGMLIGQLIACSALVAVGAIALPDRATSHNTFDGVLAAIFGIAMLVLAVTIRRRPALAERGTSSRSKEALDRLGRVHAVTASGVGLLLGFGGPKRLVVTSIAAASIAASGITGSGQKALIAWYALIATVVVWAPVLAYLAFGDRATAELDAGLKWVAHRSRPVTVGALVIVGLALIVNAVAILN
jgi:hypothetical protein